MHVRIKDWISAVYISQELSKASEIDIVLKII